MCEGEDGYQSVGVLERIINPLAAASVPVLYISTYSEDYLLIPCDQLDSAMEVFDTYGEASPPFVRVRKLAEPPEGDGEEDASELDTERAGTMTYPLHVLDEAVTHIFRIDQSSRLNHMAALIRLFFEPKPSDPVHPLRTLVETPEEMSCVCSAADWFMDYVASFDSIYGAPEGLIVIR